MAIHELRNLEELGLLRSDYLFVDELAADQQAFENAPRELRAATPDTRKNLYVLLFDSMRRALAVETEALDPLALEEIGNSSRQSLREPWCIGLQERIRSASALMIDAPAREDAGVQGEPLVLRAGPRSALARRLNKATFWGRRLGAEEYSDVLEALIRAAEDKGIIPIGLDPFRSPGLASGARCGAFRRRKWPRRRSRSKSLLCPTL